MNELRDTVEPTIHAPAVKIAGEIAEERSRQIEGEGFTLAHDDVHVGGELAAAAGVYALSRTSRVERGDEVIPRARLVSTYWPWEWHWFKSRDRRRDLIKAGALIVAEIERLDRAAERETQAG